MDAEDRTLATTVEDVCRLAWDFQKSGTVSALDLVARTRYRDRWRSITVDLLVENFRRHPDWVGAWIQWSENKRVTSGWYISSVAESTFEVGYYPSPAPVRYTDRSLACAVFVRHELASIAGVGPIPE